MHVVSLSVRERESETERRLTDKERQKIKGRQKIKNQTQTKIVESSFSVPFYFGGTSLLIVVVVLKSRHVLLGTGKKLEIPASS